MPFLAYPCRLAYILTLITYGSVLYHVPASILTLIYYLKVQCLTRSATYATIENEVKCNYVEYRAAHRYRNIRPYKLS